MLLIDGFFLTGLGIMSVLFCAYTFFFYYQQKNFLSAGTLSKKIKNLVQVSLLTAIASSIVLLINFFFPVNSVLLIRNSFQGVVVKVVGFSFGPFIGMAVAFMSEMTVLFFFPSFFYYKFFLVLLCHGFLAGLAKEWKDHFKNIFGRWAFVMISLLFFCFMSFVFLFYSDPILAPDGITNFLSIDQMFGQIHNSDSDVKFNFILLASINFGTFVIMGIIVTGIFISVGLNQKKRKKANKIFSENLNSLIAILIMAVFAEYIVNVAISSSANTSFLGSSGKSPILIFVAAILFAPVKIIFNTFIIYNIWKTINFLIKREKNK